MSNEINNLSQFITSHKACKINDKGAKLEARFGQLTLDLSSFSADKCEIYCKRLSGNGKLIVKSGTKSNSNKILSKVSQKICIDIYDGKVDIVRPPDGDGEILIFAFDVYNNPIEGDGILASSWKEIIRKCGKYNKLRLIGDKLFATTNGYIEDNFKISQIETNPDGHSVRENNKIKFIQSCEIVKIVLTDNSSVIQPIIQPYVHRNAPTQIVKPKHEIIEDAIKQVKETGIISQEEIVTLVNNDNIIFNSSSSRGFSNYSCNNTGSVKNIKSNGKEYIVLRKGGSCCIPISAVKGNTDYICIIKCKKLNGNGKFYANLITSDTDFIDMSSVVCSTNMTDKQIYLTSRPTEHGKIHKIHFAMLDNCIGEVLIENIMIIEGAGFTKHVGKSYSSTSSPTFSTGYKLDCGFNSTDSVYINAKRYARFEFLDKVRYKNFNVSGNLAAMTVSGLSWISKILPFFPNINLIKNNSNLDNTTLITSMGSILPAKSIWIDVFKEEEIIDSDIEKLKSIKNIYTPSFYNLEYLKEQCPDSNVQLLCRHLPFYTPKENKYFTNKEYIISFCRDKHLIDKLTKFWHNGLPKLALVGARGWYSDYIIPINEYLSFDELLYILINSKGILDLYNGPGYQSAFLYLANLLGIPVTSSNFDFLSIPLLEKGDKYNIPSDATLSEITNKLLSTPKISNFNIEEYSNSFNNTINKLFS